MEINITPASERAKQAAKDPIEQSILWILERFDKPMSAAALRARVATAFSINNTFQKLRVNPKFRPASVAQRSPKSKRLHKDWADAEGLCKGFKLALAIL